MKGKITEIWTSSRQTGIKVVELLKEIEQDKNQPEAVQPTSWEEATKGFEIPQQQPSQDREMER